MVEVEKYIFSIPRDSVLGVKLLKPRNAYFLFHEIQFNEIQIRYKPQKNRHKGSKNPNFVQQGGYFLKEKLVRNDSAEFFKIFFQ